MNYRRIFSILAVESYHLLGVLIRRRYPGYAIFCFSFLINDPRRPNFSTADCVELNFALDIDITMVVNLNANHRRSNEKKSFPFDLAFAYLRLLCMVNKLHANLHLYLCNCLKKPPSYLRDNYIAPMIRRRIKK